MLLPKHILADLDYYEIKTHSQPYKYQITLFIRVSKRFLGRTHRKLTFEFSDICAVDATKEPTASPEAVEIMEQLRTWAQQTYEASAQGSCTPREQILQDAIILALDNLEDDPNYPITRQNLREALEKLT